MSIFGLDSLFGPNDTEPRFGWDGKPRENGPVTLKDTLNSRHSYNSDDAKRYRGEIK